MTQSDFDQGAMQSSANKDNYTNSVQGNNNTETEPLPQKKRKPRSNSKGKTAGSSTLKRRDRKTKTSNSKITKPKKSTKMCLANPQTVEPEAESGTDTSDLEIEETPDTDQNHQLTGECSYESGCVWSIGTPSMTVKCTICKGCYHLQCVGIKKASDNKIWVCPVCASAGKLVRSLLNEVNELKEYIKQSEIQKSDLKYDLSRKTEESTALQVENAVLKERLSNIQDQIPKSPNKDPETLRRKQEKKVLIIGDSNVRSLKGFLNEPTNELQIIPGARFTDIKHYIESDVKKGEHSQIVIHVGTVDCSSDITLQDAANEADYMLQDAKDQTFNGDVVFSSICPRFDIKPANERVRKLNTMIQGICDKKQVKYIDNSLTFTFKDDSIDQQAIAKDGLHLNREGGRRLAKNLSIHAGIKTNSRQQNSFEQQKPNTSV